MFLLISGWLIVLAAVALLPPGAQLESFLPAGLLVEAVGLALLFRSHRIAPGGDR